MHVQLSGTAGGLNFAMSLHLHLYIMSEQGFSYLSEVWATGLLNLGKKHLEPSKLGKLDAVKKNRAAILN